VRVYAAFLDSHKGVSEGSVLLLGDVEDNSFELSKTDFDLSTVFN